MKLVLLLIRAAGRAGILISSVDGALIKKQAEGPKLDHLLDDFQVSTLDADTVSFREITKGRKHLVVFVKPGCSHCESQLAALVGIDFIADNILPSILIADIANVSEPETQAFTSRFRPHFAIYLDRAGTVRRH